VRVHIRNICAHHSCLRNRSPTYQPKPPMAGEIPLLDHLAADHYGQTRLYAPAAVMQYLLRTINPTTSWGDRLRQHLATFPAVPTISVAQTGFPSDWDQLPLWS
jgi:abortive infection bacteriophage resistance protein